jgi:exodeoxyribonuclease X
MLARVIDIETTGVGPEAEVIEFGAVDVSHGAGRPAVATAKTRLFRPLRGIPPETMAVHHITEADFAPDDPPCDDALLRACVFGDDVPDVLVAHNCEFERTFIPARVTGSLPWICTYKAALRAWPDAPRHSNQVLRYWLGLSLDHALAMPPHRAGPDAFVTAHLFAELLSVATVDQMIAWTAEPRAYPTVSFGKHRGSKWSDVPADYLQWMTRQADMEADAKWCAQQELHRRRAVAAA